MDSYEICAHWIGISEPTPLSSTDFEIFPAWKHPDDISHPNITLPKDPDASMSPAVIFYQCHAERSDALTASPYTHKYQTVMKDENGNNQWEEHCNLLYWLGLHPGDLPGKWIHIPHKTGIPTSMTVGKLIDDYWEALQQDPYCKTHFMIKFT